MGPPAWMETLQEGAGLSPGAVVGSGPVPAVPPRGHGPTREGGRGVLGAGSPRGRSLRPFFSPPPDNSLVSLAESSAPEARGQSGGSARPWAPFPQSPLAERGETEAEGLLLPTPCPRGSATAPAAPPVSGPGPAAARPGAEPRPGCVPLSAGRGPEPAVGSP